MAAWQTFMGNLNLIRGGLSGSNESAPLSEKERDALIQLTLQPNIL